MPKINVFMTLKNKLYNEQIKGTYEGFLTDDKITYKEEEKFVTIYRNSNTIKMIRRCKENLIILNFAKGEIKKSQLEPIGLEPIEIETETLLLESNDNQIYIRYKTKIKEEIMGDYEFNLQYEVKE